MYKFSAIALKMPKWFVLGLDKAVLEFILRNTVVNFEKRVIEAALYYLPAIPMQSVVTVF